EGARDEEEEGKSGDRKAAGRKKEKAPAAKGKFARKPDQYILSEDDEFSGGHRKLRRKGGGLKEHKFEKPTDFIAREIELPEAITVQNLANRLSVKASVIIKSLMSMGVMATINQVLDQDTSALIVEE